MDSVSAYTSQALGAPGWERSCGETIHVVWAQHLRAELRQCAERSIRETMCDVPSLMARPDGGRPEGHPYVSVWTPGREVLYPCRPTGSG